MQERILELIYYLLCAIAFFLIGEGMFHNRTKEKKRYPFVIIIYIVVLSPVIFINGKINYYIPLLLNILMYVFLFQGSIKSKLVRFLGIYILANVIESFIEGIGIFLLPRDMSSLTSTSYYIVFIILTIILSQGLLRLEWMQKFIACFDGLKRAQYVVIILIAFSGMSLIGLSEVVLAYIENTEVGIVLHIAITVLLGTTFLGIIWFVFGIQEKEYYFKQNKLKEEIIYAQQRYYQNIYEKDREMRKFRHDINSQLGIFRLLLEEGKIDKALEHLGTVDDHFGKIIGPQYYTGNEIVDVIVNQKCVEAQSKDIDIIVDGKMKNANFLDAYDLCTIFSNALNNGMEAYEKMQNVERVIYVTILEHNQMIMFHFTNAATSEMYYAVKENITTKEDMLNHGFGVGNIRIAVEKNGGEMEYFYEEGKLTLEICFRI